ncbi:hypothetical protein PR048_031870 [Dryococelus australis]|uniref:Uncharacterized protein n=1 Tax=Dryococelus australis TaxID=614101 RepID=A0ABQ9G954_9NEOP|nr:hypothetical protein PR048_031870 [Dryococelus australis]
MPYLKHLECKEAEREHRNEDKEAAKNDSNILAFNFDLQAVFNTPKCAVGPFFYVRKLAVYNLALYNLGNQDYRNLRMHLEVPNNSNWNTSGLELYLTAAQGSRKMPLACMCLYVVRNHPTIQLIDHPFFEPGHSQMECDSIHSKIEQKAKAIPVYTPDEWLQIMRTARTNPRHYEVTMLLHDDFQDFNSTKEYLRPCNSSSAKVPAKYRDAVWLQYRKEVPDTVFIKTD